MVKTLTSAVINTKQKTFQTQIIVTAFHTATFPCPLQYPGFIFSHFRIIHGGLQRLLPQKAQKSSNIH